MTDFVAKVIKPLLEKLAAPLGLAWWVKIDTATPRCTYYFGPFLSQQEADSARTGYVEDLEQEGAQGIAVTVQRCKPTDLTIDYEGESGNVVSGSASPVFN